MTDEMTQKETNAEKGVLDSGYIGDMGWLSNFAIAGNLAPPWWSHRRDKYLLDFAFRSGYFMSAQYKVNSKLCAIFPRVLSRNPNIKSHQEMAEEYQSKLLEGSNDGEGWQVAFQKSLTDYLILDNGTFLEVIGDGKKDGPIVGAAKRIDVLDSLKCTRTGDKTFPVVVEDNGTKYKLHYTRVIYLANNATSRSNMNGVGLSWLSRCLDISQSLLDMIIYKQEKLGSRPLRQMIVGSGITASQIAGAIKMAENSMDNQGLNNYSKTVVLGSPNTDIGIETIDLSSVPDGFDFQTDLEMGMFAMAMAIGIPPRDLWPATTTGATKADAMYQHVGGSSGYSVILDQFANAIGGNPYTPTSLYSKFLPPSLKLVFDYVDDTQDEASAVISKTRSETRERDINNGVITVRVARQQMVEDGEISQDQYDALELSSGRLPDGTPILRLFNTTDELILALLDIGIPEPLNIEANIVNREAILRAISDKIRYAEMIVVNTSRANQRQKAEQAIAALMDLRKLYESYEDNSAVEDENEIAEETKAAKTFRPPKAVAREAQRVLDWEEKYGDEVQGGTRVGKIRAQQLANREPLTLDTIRRMFQFFARHEGNQAVDPKFKDKPWRDKGLVGWLRWGGDAGKRWANRIWEANRDKQVGGGDDMPPEVEEYEQAIIDLIELANDGELTEEEFETQLEELTTALIIALFLAGAGLESQDQLDDEQREALGEQVSEGTQTVPEVTEQVFAGFYLPIAEGGRGWNIVAKAALWAIFLAGAYELGKLHNRAKQQDFLRWRVSPGKDSCTDCLRLNGQIHTRKEWLDSGWLPKRRRLECNGYNCGCYFEDAEGPSRGRF